MSSSAEINLSCPLPIQQYPKVLLAHGGGGKLMHQLIEKIFVAAFGNPTLQQGHDSAVLNLSNTRLAFTTDSYVVHPLFFPGGDIGSLAVHGTVNDLAMSGARPLYLSVGFILEEGLPMETLWRIVQSMQWAAEKAGVQIVTGDTKVVDHGKGDGVYINTSGIGVVEHPLEISPRAVQSGDVILVNGDIGRHGMAVMAVREGLEFESCIESDSAPVSGQVLELLASGIPLHCLRDTTRGGMATTLNEIAQSAGFGILLEENRIPIRPDVQAACEILGFDPLYVACEGRFVAFLPAASAQQALEMLHRHEGCGQAAIIGKVTEETSGLVTLKNRIGSSRIIDILSGEQLPRIC
jgi:hydrogenase expression/formation protein HypE